MKQENHISSFDEWVKKSLEQAQIEPPAGVWEAVQHATGSGSATGSGAGSGMGTLQKISRFILEQLGWKAALGVLGFIGATYGVSQLISHQQEEKSLITVTEKVQESREPESQASPSNAPFTPEEDKQTALPKTTVSPEPKSNQSSQQENRATDKQGNLSPDTKDPAQTNTGGNTDPLGLEKPLSQPDFVEEKEVNCAFTRYTLSSKDDSILNWYVDGNFKSRGASLILTIHRNQVLRVSARDQFGKISSVHTMKHESGPEIRVSSEYMGQNTYRLKAEVQDFEMLAWNLSEDVEPVFNRSEITHTFVRREQPYRIALVVVSKDGCADTVQTEINAVEPDKFRNPVIPNIFTPHALDGLNDEFRIEMDAPEYFHLVIRDLKGQVVFESKDYQDAWNGKRQNTGELCPKGKYYYMLMYRMPGMSAQSRQNTLLLN